MKRHHIILILIILIGILFRSYQLTERFLFAADGDLYSWIVKDIVVNHHFRLVGQLTSAPGIFIGPLFYYLLVPFFLLAKMDPLGVSLLGIIIGILTILSYYFVLGKLFNKTTGLIAGFLHAILLSTVGFDRWIVPTLPTKLWAIWYFYVVIKLTRGNFTLLPVLGILIGLIWHVHIALITTLAAVPVAIYLSKKIPTKKQVILFFVGLIITSLPLILFEARHHFQQFFSLIENFTIPREGPSGFKKFSLVLGMIVQNTNTLFFAPYSFQLTKNIFFPLLILLSPLLLIRQKLVYLKDLFPIYFWVFGVIAFFSISSSPISEYYFSNLEMLFITLTSLLFAFIFQKGKIFKIIILTVLFILFIKDTYFFLTQYIYHKDYFERKSIVAEIKKDMLNQKYPCAGITYITALGENVGFRYFFYMENIHLVHPSLEIPVYNIVLPDELSKEVNIKYGHIGLILPTSIPSKETIQKSCEVPNTNLTDPVLGYVE